MLHLYLVIIKAKCNIYKWVGRVANNERKRGEWTIKLWFAQKIISMIFCRIRMPSSNKPTNFKCYTLYLVIIKAKCNIYKWVGRVANNERKRGEWTTKLWFAQKIILMIFCRIRIPSSNKPTNFKCYTCFIKKKKKPRNKSRFFLNPYF